MDLRGISRLRTSILDLDLDLSLSLGLRRGVGKKGEERRVIRIIGVKGHRGIGIDRNR